MVGDFDSPLDPGPFGGNEPSGCVWHIVLICIATVLFIGFLKWIE